MTPIIKDFISRATVLVEALLASCRRFSDTPGRDACPAVAYVLGCEYFEIFMWLMRRENSPRRCVRHTLDLCEGLYRMIQSSSSPQHELYHTWYRIDSSPHQRREPEYEALRHMFHLISPRSA